ncbi:hypothetical protein A2110_02290 [Candidatus Jorgensenbacteria bacterium GWA1_54_12]|uniref:Membrane insertase YidC/Oxa/ALB C-terminal domain-containing protein n=1 Tax=Candidatus Jorgensenbacteria bacterium GWA1_54_12 TaxID=1798468 RepID=A0A1F6BLB2_9BACT|nr:MAG: hypothetical protein A2110_02290 [Candidatus Jorgensenbacteria bacterium GWA1_54_12]
MIQEVILSVLQWLYNNLAFHNLFVAILLLTLAVRVVLFPLFYKSSKDQLVMRELSPKMEEIKTLYKDDRQKQAEELMRLYKEHKLNPLSGILILVVQLPIFIALFKVFRDSELLTSLFGDGSMFLGANLALPSIVVSIVAAALQYVSGRMTEPGSKSGGSMAKFGKMMLYMMPFLTLFILLKLPAALGVYWAVSTAFSIGQTLVIKRRLAYSKSRNGNAGVTQGDGGTYPPHGV